MQGSRISLRVPISSSTCLVVVALAAFTGCGSPDRYGTTSPTGGTTSTGGTTTGVGSGGGSGGVGSGGSESSGGTVGQGGSGTGGNGPGGTGGTSNGGSGGSDTGGTTARGGGGDSGGSSGGSGGGSGGSTVKGGSGGGTGGSAGSSGGTNTTASGGTSTGGITVKGGNGGGTGGSAGSSGGTNTGGTTVNGGSGGTGGAGGTGGSSGTGPQGPCDIYQAANTPCVAAHSTVRALYGAYSGPLYQLRKSSGTKDVPVLAAGGYVDISVHDSFCPSGTACTISIIYDQSPNKNDLTKSPKGTWLPNGGNEANADLGKITINGHTAHGIYVNNDGSHTNPATDVGYRCVDTKGVAINDEPEAMYMVLDGTRYSSICCFDYGNAEKAVAPGAAATMEAIYWGNSTQWARGGGNGPWVAADLELGMFEGDSANSPTNTSVTGWTFVTAMLKGPSGNAMGLKAGNAQSGKLETKWDGKRPAGYAPKKLEGSIVLGTGGDGSDFGKGTFFEGVMTSGNPPDSVDDAVQANIVAAGYGK
jgi:hypothetical protein